jgi:hypothetical protein
MSEAKSLGWAVAEELAFDELMSAGNLERLPAIRLFRRCGGDLKRAVEIARANRVESRPCRDVASIAA